MTYVIGFEAVSYVRQVRKAERAFLNRMHVTKYRSCLGRLSGSIAEHDFRCHFADMQAK